MGAAYSKVEEDKALQLCSERKKFVRQALDGRCSLAAAHVAYVQSLRKTGTALRKFVEPDAPMESSLYTSLSAAPEPLALTEKSVWHLSLPPAPSLSRRVDVAETLAPHPHPTSFRVNHMKFHGSYSTKVEERPASPVIGMVMSSAVPENTTPPSTDKPGTSTFRDPVVPPGTPPWDYFGPSHPIDHQLLSRERKGMTRETKSVDHIARYREDDLIFCKEDEDEASVSGTEASQYSEDEFDEPSTNTLVRRFKNLNRVNGQCIASPSLIVPSATSVASETEFFRDEGNSPDLSPLQDSSSAATLRTNSKKTPIKEDQAGTKVVSKEFIASIKDIEFLFVEASESGGEVPRMLEANKLHFRPILPNKDSVPLAFTYLKACFSCGEVHGHDQEEPAQAAIKYLTWHRTASSRSSSSRNFLGLNSKDDIEDTNASLYDNFCMTSGSHASTLDRLYAWERKLYDEVKASELVRRHYDIKCKLLRQLESKRERSNQIDGIRAIVKDLYSSVKVAIHRIDSISKRIEELRDRELQPQLEELIEGLSRMWEVMFECHKRQFQIISAAQNITDRAAFMRSEYHRQITINLETELNGLSASFARWIDAQKSYLQAIDNWLHKCVSMSPKIPRRRRRAAAPQIRSVGPPIYVICGVWLESLNSLPTKSVTDSIKALAVETSQFLSHQEKNRAKSLNRAPSTLWKAENGTDPAVNMLRNDASEDWSLGFNRFRSGLVRLVGQLNNYSELTVKKYADLDKAIKNAKAINKQFKAQSQKVHR